MNKPIARFLLSPLASALENLRLAGWPPQKRPASPAAAGERPEQEPGVRFESLEPRVLLSGDVNPAALMVEGELTAPGETDQYEFTVEGTQRVVFDSLTNRDDLNWTLDGGNETAVYRFTAAAGEQFVFDTYTYATGVDNVQWRLIDPWGRQEGETYNLAYSYDTFDVRCSGEYLLLMEGAAANTEPFDYDFILHRVPESAAPLPLMLDTATTAHIDWAGQTARFEFELSEETPVLFDGLTNYSYSFTWSLAGSDGVMVSNASGIGDASSYANGCGWLRLPAGTYCLTINPDSTNTGDYPFRLLTDASAGVSDRQASESHRPRLMSSSTGSTSSARRAPYSSTSAASNTPSSPTTTTTSSTPTCGTCTTP